MSPFLFCLTNIILKSQVHYFPCYKKEILSHVYIAENIYAPLYPGMITVLGYLCDSSHVLHSKEERTILCTVGRADKSKESKIQN